MSLLRFSVFEIDQTSGELTRQGRRVAIASQPLKVLSLLASRPGVIVTREELRRAVWCEGTHVDFERGLNFCIASARAAIGDEARRPRFIETIPRQGYRFIAEVRCLPLDPVVAARSLSAPTGVASSARQRRRYRFLAGAAAACLIAAHGDTIVRAHDREHTTPAALEAFEQGLRLPSDADGLRARLAAFDASRALDPLFAEAWYAVGETYASMAGLRVLPPRTALAGATEAADRALSLEDRPGSRVLRGQLHLQFGWDVTRSRADLAAALRQAPDSDAAWSAYASMLSAAGDDAGAMTAADRADAISPTCDLQWLESARIHYRARRYDTALEKLAQARRLGPTEDGSSDRQVEVHRLSLLINVQREDWPAARTEAAALLGLWDVTPDQRQAWAALPARRAVMTYLQWVDDRLRPRALRGELSGTVMARINALLGRDDDALAWLDHAVREKDPEVIFAGRDPAFDRVRLSPRWPGPALETSTQPARQSPARSGNPIVSGWYADPEARIFEREYWIYPTYSAPYDDQTFFDAFSSTDLVTWTKHSKILDATGVKWATRAVWAPSVVERDGSYYMFFGANDIQNDTQLGGIGVARAAHPGGPFVDHLGHPLVDRFHNGAQPIDPFVFRDEDGTFYLIYGGWRHCNIATLNRDFTGFVPFADGSTFKEITPAGYVEGSFMFVKGGKYYFMWSEGGWTGPNYAVAYAIGSSPLGPFERVGKILQQDPSVATGAGHHSVLHASGSDAWYIVYHRRPLGETDRNHRVVCIDELRFDATGAILPVTITKEGVARDPLRR